VGKHTDKLGEIADFRAPWETESGEDADIDKSKLKRFIFNLKKGEATALDSVEDSKAAVTAAEKARDDALDAAEKNTPAEAVNKIKRLETENADLKGKIEANDKANELAALRKKVLGDLPEKYAKYVEGETEEDLETSLEQVREDFGLGDGEENQEEEEENILSSRPRSNLRNVTDPKGGGADKEVDYDAVADQIIGGGRAFG
jgi:hypothetical protein